MADEDDRLSHQRLWRRGQEPEFSGLANFTDAVFAIALAFVNTTLTLMSWLVLSPLVGAALDGRIKRIDATPSTEG